MRSLPLRRRMTIAVAVVVAATVALVALAAYVAVRGELRAEVDRALEDQLDFRGGPPPGRGGGPGFGALPARRGGPTPYIQLIDSSGNTFAVAGTERVELPVDDRVRDVAAGVAPAFLADADVDGTHVRVLTTPIPNGAAQLGRSLEPADAVLSRMRLILLLVCAGGIALAILFGRLVSRNVVAPIAEVTEAARHIAATEDLGRRIEVTSLRTNIEVLAESEALPADERARLLQDVEEQTTELGMLVADLIELARGDEPRRESEDVRLDDLVAESVTRAQRHAPGVRFEARLEPIVVEGTRERLSRAVNNLLDNAARHSPPGGVVEVRVDIDGLRVRDHGSGVDPADLPHLFDRFYRGASARGRPGSGLGLAIVRQVAEQHGGSVHAVNAAGGGAEFVLELPAAPLAVSPVA